uniref:Ig-like domain-containing protein n=1 Tax=Naja naja TaxID=35670 RepID=A0A8C6Y4B0_NAJNA
MSILKNHARAYFPVGSYFWGERLLNEFLPIWIPSRHLFAFHEVFLHLHLDPNQGQPHHVAVGFVDGQVFLHYDSHSRKMEPRVSWMEKVGKEDPNYWVRNTQMARDTEEASRGDLETLRLRYNQKLKKKQNKPPVVTMTRRTEVEDGMETHICRQHGFYPREIDASWTRDGEVWLQDTFHGSVAPNADGTYHYWLSIRIDPKEKGRYRCHVEHDGLQKPLDLALEGERLQGGTGSAVFLAGGLWESVSHDPN